MNPPPDRAKTFIDPPAVPEMELVERIGSGAYGEVWLARNTATGARRAVKIVYRATFSDQRPFDREFEGIKKFEAISHSHPSQLALFQVGKSDAAGYFYYVMELADCVPNCDSYSPLTLRRQLDHGRRPASEVLAIGLALSEALAHLHAAGLVHRDVKPSNIIFVNGRPKLADIGLVTDLSDNRSIVGTEGYLPPEGPGTPAADIFAMGRVLYETLTGLNRDQFPELPVDIRQWADASLAFEINTIILKASAVNAADRYADTASLLRDLQHLAAGKSIRHRQSRQRLFSFGWKFASVVLLGLLALFVVTKAFRGANDPDSFENSGTTNFAAWQSHSLAMKMVATYTVQSLSNSVKELERALELDPNYARAWASLAMEISLEADYGYLNGSAALTQAKACIERAVRLEPDLKRAACTLAEINLALDYDFPAAERLYRKGLSDGPARSSAYHNFARILVCYGRFAEAESILRDIIAEDPARGGSYIVLAQVYGATDRPAQALRAYEQAEQTSNRPYLYFNRADLRAALHDKLGAAHDLLRFIELDGFASLDPLNEGAALRLTLNQKGPVEFLRRHIQMLEERRNKGLFVSAYDLARLYQHSGNDSKALDYLELAVDEHRGMALAVKVNPLFKPFHDHPRFQAVLRRFNLQ